MGCIRAKQCEVALSPKPRARKAQAEGHELHAPSSVRRPHTACAAQAEGKNSGKGDEQAEVAGGESARPVGAMSCTRAEQCEEACAAQAKGVNSGRGDEKAEPAGGGERHACQGYELHARQAV